MDNRYLHEIWLFCKRWWNFPGSWRRSRKLTRFEVGDIYLDCSYHPVIVTEVERCLSRQPGAWDYDLAGVSMIDGSWPRSCSVYHCAPEKIDHLTALLIAANWDAFVGSYSRMHELYRTHPELQQPRKHT